MKNADRRCKALAKSGKRCRAPATQGGLCFFHANPDKASELGRIGGRKNHRAAGESADPLPRLDNAIAVRETVARLIADVYSGKLPPRVASGLATLLNLQLRAIETTDLEWRVAELEKRLAAKPAEQNQITSLLETIARIKRKTVIQQSKALAGLDKGNAPQGVSH